MVLRVLIAANRIDRTFHDLVCADGERLPRSPLLGVLFGVALEPEVLRLLRASSCQRTIQPFRRLSIHDTPALRVGAVWAECESTQVRRQRVDPRGLEPLTSWLPAKRSTS
jgi:hypothetical protein